MSIVSKLSKSNATVMGIDSNTNSIAFSIFGDDKLIHYGKIDIVGQDIYEKIRDAGTKSRALCKHYDVEYIAIESSVFVKSAQVAIKMAYMTGAILSGLTSRGADSIAIPPRTWQQYIGNITFTKEMKALVVAEHQDKSANWISNEIRKRRKRYTIDYFNKMFNISCNDDDVSDAIGVAYYVVHNKT